MTLFASLLFLSALSVVAALALLRNDKGRKKISKEREALKSLQWGVLSIEKSEDVTTWCTWEEVVIADVVCLFVFVE